MKKNDVNLDTLNDVSDCGVKHPVVDELDLSDPKKFREYAARYSTDDLLDALNQCKTVPKKYGAILKILKIQSELSNVLNDWNIDNFNLKTLLDKFYADPDPYSLRNRLIDNDAEDPELSFKFFLLKALTLSLEGGTLSEDENDFLNEFKIDVTDTIWLNNLKYQLELDLNSFYSKERWVFVDTSDDDLMHQSLKLMLNIMNESKESDIPGRLEGKKIMPWHCAYNDSPEWLSLHGEDVVVYDLWDEYLPHHNQANSLELVNKIYNCSVGELEELCRQGNNIDDFEWWKKFYKDDEKSYKLFLLHMLGSKTVDLMKMYEEWDRFFVVRSTYNDKEVFNGDYISCRYVDICSIRTWKIYRALSD